MEEISCPEEEKYAILRELVVNCAAEQSQEGDFVEDIAKEISVVKGGRIALEHYYSSCCPDEVFRQIFQGYRKVLNERRKLDFDDMLLSCYELLKKPKRYPVCMAEKVSLYSGG